MSIIDAPLLWALVIVAAVPTLGPERPVDPATGTLTAELSVQRRPAIASLPALGEAYAVWEDYREGEGAQVWGVSISPLSTGVLSLGSRGERLSPLLPFGAEHSAPAVAAFSDGVDGGYLVSWHSGDPGAIPKLQWRYVSRFGPLAVMPANDVGAGALPAVACVGEVCLLVYSDLSVPMLPRLKAKQFRVGGNGLVEVANSIDIPSGAARDVAVTAVPELRGWALAWLSHPTSTSAQLFAGFMRPDGGLYPPTGAPLTPVVPSFTAIGPPSIASADGGAIVAFTAPVTASQPVWTAMLAGDGTVTQPATPRAAAGKYAMDPVIQFDGTSFNLAWGELNGFFSVNLARQRFKPGDNASGDIPISLPGILTVHRWPSIASLTAHGSRHMLVAFEASTFTLSDVYVFNEVNEQPENTGPLTVGNDAQGRVNVAWLGNAFGAVWLDSRRRDPILSMFGARFSPDAGRISPSTLMLTDAGLVPDQPVLAETGGRVLLVWKEHLATPGIYAKGLTTSLAPLANQPPQGTLLSAGVPVDVDSPPALASSDDGFFVAWASEDGGAWVRRANGDGTPTDNAPLSLKPRRAARFPSAAWDGRAWLVAWEEDAAPDVSKVVLTRLAPDAGTVLGTTVDVDPSARAQYRPLVLSNGKGTSLVVWTEDRLGFALRGSFVDAQGSRTAVPIDIAGGVLRPGLQPLSGGFDGEDFHVVYRQLSRELDVATVQLDGGVISELALGPFAGRSPSVAFAPNGAGLVLYERYDASQTTTRAFLRSLGQARVVIAPDGGKPIEDSGTPVGVPPVMVVPELTASCGMKLEAKFDTADGSAAKWELVEGPGALDSNGRYVWEGARVKTRERLIVRASNADGTTVSEPLPVNVDCGDQLEFQTCGCSSAGLPLVPLLLLALGRRRRRGATVLAALCGLAGCGRTAFYDAKDQPVAPPPPPPVLFCGDGEVTAPEACDDGDTDATDECLPDCARARCGDGYVRIGVEACDDGNADENDACTSRCSLTSCGNGRLDPREQCDDGNLDDTDACASTCLLARCGDGHVFAGIEACDDGNASNTDDCTTACRLPRCGDGFVHAGVEPCDDGNTVDDDFCTNACKLPVCGDGRRAGGEECDLGAMNGDRPAFLISQPSGTRIATDALVRARTAVSFYDYRSASSHTGLERVGESRIYLYVDSGTGRLSLVLTHGIDFDSSGERQPSARVNMDLTGLPNGVTLDVVDDPGLSPAEATKTGNTAAGRWSFNQNSDGMVLGGLPFPGVWKVTVTPQFMMGLSTWGWVRQDAVRIPLVMTEPITIEAFDTSTFCGTDCRVPRCGDGKFQGGEVCDDGNVVGGDGCAADCKSLR